MKAWAGQPDRIAAPSHAAGMLVVVLVALAVGLRPIDDLDIFWQVKLGHLFLERGFDLTEPFCYGLAGQPLSWVGWLGQVIFASVHGLAGWEGVQALHILLYATAFGLVWRRIERLRVGTLAALAAVLLALTACLSNCSERPQTFAFCAFAALLLLSDTGGSRLIYWAIVVPLLLLWQNVHPSLPIAAVVMGLRAAGRFMDERCGPADDSGQWRRPLANAAIAGIAVFCTPTGWGILDIGSRNAAMSRWLGIGEWQPAHLMFAQTIGFWTALLVGCVLWLRTRPRLPWRELLPVLLLTAASLCWTRMIVFWALAAAPLLAYLLHVNGPVLRQGSHDGLGCRWRLVRRCLTGRQAARGIRRPWLPVGLALLMAALPWLRPHLSVLPPSRRSLFDPQLPLAGVERLGEVVGMGRIYNYREWGGLLAFAGAPRWRIAIDGRIYRHSRDAWRSYAAVALGTDEWIEVSDRDRPTALFLRPDHDRLLIERLDGDPAWLDYYQDANCHVFISRQNALATEGRNPRLGRSSRGRSCPARLLGTKAELSSWAVEPSRPARLPIGCAGDVPTLPNSPHILDRPKRPLGHRLLLSIYFTTRLTQRVLCVAANSPIPLAVRIR